ncbi:TerC family protein [Hymenobacter sp. 102]|uniref:TerC family protein n=1 Tax=Hymenobacter sp. 102 TaxID=3403152 RepID=UPI003CF7433C
MNQYLQQILDNPLAALAIVGNLIIIESLLSVDNAAVLATMVGDLPREQRQKALRYGIIGAYVFRGICILFAAYLVNIWFLKPLGGLYLLYLAVSYFLPKSSGEEDAPDKERSWIYRRTLGAFGQFWATVALIELMDLAFSIDNVFAVVAFTDNLILVCLGVFIGILAMRLVAQAFVLLMGRYPFLETAAFVVIGLLGLKLLLSLVEHFAPAHPFSRFLSSETAEAGLTILTVTIFAVPLGIAWLRQQLARQ